MTFAALKTAIQQGKVPPVSFLYGPESFLLDALTEAFEAHTLPEEQRGFNQEIVYGYQVSGGQLVGLARSFPVMAPKRLVVVREAQSLKKPDLDILASYLQHPVDSTVLVLVWKGKTKPDKRTAFGKSALSAPVVFEAKTLYEDKIPVWLVEYAAGQGYELPPAQAHWLVTGAGTELGVLVQELEKVFLNLRPRGETRVTQAALEAFVNVDREYNTFELQRVLGQRNALKALEIVQQLAKNPKAHPPIGLVSQLFTFYSKIGVLAQQRVFERNAAAQLIGLSPFIAEQYTAAAQRHPYAKVLNNLHFLHHTDLQLKGIQPTRQAPGELLQNLVFQLVADVPVPG